MTSGYSISLIRYPARGTSQYIYVLRGPLHSNSFSYIICPSGTDDPPTCKVFFLSVLSFLTSSSRHIVNHLTLTLTLTLILIKARAQHVDEKSGGKRTVLPAVQVSATVKGRIFIKFSLNSVHKSDDFSLDQGAVHGELISGTKN